RDLPEARELFARDHAEVGVRQHALLERALAGPDDVGGEVGEAELVEPWLHRGRLAGEDQELLDPAPGGAVDQLLDFLRLVQVRLVGGERAVLAVATAGPRKRERDVARVCDPAHPLAPYLGALLGRPAARRRRRGVRRRALDRFLRGRVACA